MLADIFGPDLLIVAIVLVLLLFGGAAIPKLARNLGSAKNEFEKGLDKTSVLDPVVFADDGAKITKVATPSHVPQPVIILDETDHHKIERD